jgi:hypothetical protein
LLRLAANGSGTYGCKRPPERKKPVTLEMPAAVKAGDPAKTSKRIGRSSSITNPVMTRSVGGTESADTVRKSAIVTAISRKMSRIARAPRSVACRARDRAREAARAKSDPPLGCARAKLVDAKI